MWSDITGMAKDRHMGCVSLPDALATIFISTPSGVSGEHYDKVKQQQRRAVTYLCIGRSDHPVHEQSGLSAAYSWPSLLYRDPEVHR
jgi:hypothetical protein